MKLYDGRGKRFKTLIDLTLIMKENRLNFTEVLPKHARAKWFVMWFWWGIAFAILFGLLILFMVLLLFLSGERIDYGGVIKLIFGALSISMLSGGFAMLVARKWTWRSKAVAIRTLAQQGFCPKCGYIIRDTPVESDGCTPCSECGYAWRVEPVDS